MGQKVKTPPLEEISALQGGLSSGDQQSRVESAASIAKIGLAHPLRSDERAAAANALFVAYANEKDDSVAMRLKSLLAQMGYRVYETFQLQNDESRPGPSPVTYHMDGPYPPRRQVPKKKEEKKPPPAETKKDEKPPEKPPEEGKWSFNPSRGAPPQMPRIVAYAPLKPDKEADQTKKIFPLSLPRTAREFVDKLPTGESEAGMASIARIDKDALYSDAKMRMLPQDIERGQPVIPPSFSEYASSRVISIDVPILGRLVTPFYDPLMYVEYSRVVSEARRTEGLRRVGRFKAPSVPGLEKIAPVGPASAIEKFALLIALDKSANAEERRLAAHIIGWRKVTEGMPLLSDIVRNPKRHGADPELVRASALALLEIGSEEAITELKKDPDQYAIALSSMYLINRPWEKGPSSWKEGDELIKLLIGGDVGMEGKIALAQALSFGGSKIGNDFLSSALKDPSLSQDYRRLIEKQFKEAAWERNTEGLLIALASDEKESARSSAAVALGGSRSLAGLHALQHLLGDSGGAVRYRAMQSIFGISLEPDPALYELSKSASEILDKLVEKSDPMAVVILSTQGGIPRSKFTILLKAASDQNSLVREDALKGMCLMVSNTADVSDRLKMARQLVDSLGFATSDSVGNVREEAKRSLQTLYTIGIADARIMKRIRELLR